MEIPEHVRQQAMDAVANRETTDQIRAFKDSGVEAAPGFTQVEASQALSQASYGPLTDDIRRQAMDAVSHRETTAQISLMADSDHITPGHTPSLKNSLIAERIAEMHETGQSVGAIQQSMTKDNFGREHDIG